MVIIYGFWVFLSSFDDYVFYIITPFLGLNEYTFTSFWSGNFDWIDSNIVRKNFVFQQESHVSMEQQWESCSIGEYSSGSPPDLLISDQAPNLRVVLTSQFCLCPPEWSVWNTGPWRLCVCWPLCSGTLLLWLFLYSPFTFTSIFNTNHHDYFGNELFSFPLPCRDTL